MAFVVEGRLLCLVFCSTMASRTFACAILALRSSVYSNIRFDSIQCATFIIRSVCVVARFLSSGKEAGTSDLTSKAAKYSPASLPFQHRCIVTLDARGQTDPTHPGNSAMDSPAPYLANSKLVSIRIYQYAVAVASTVLILLLPLLRPVWYRMHTTSGVSSTCITTHLYTPPTHTLTYFTKWCSLGSHRALTRKVQSCHRQQPPRLKSHILKEPNSTPTLLENGRLACAARYV